MIRIVNFPFCNYASVSRVLKTNNYSFADLEKDNELTARDILILPGVGSFSEGMNYLQEQSLITKIVAHANSGGKIIGICLGLQLLFNKSEESPGIDGLKLIDGRVIKIPTCNDFNVPHIGWNSLTKTNSTPGFLKEFFDQTGNSKSDYYFVHSYYALPSKKHDSIAKLSHPMGDIDVAFHRKNIYAVQFHPEKSGPTGYRLLKQIIDQ